VTRSARCTSTWVIAAMIMKVAAKVHIDKRQRGRTPRALWRWMKRRAAVEPSIGHLKNEHRLERNRLKDVPGDAINAVLAAAAMNFQKLLGAFWRVFLSLPDPLLQPDSEPYKALKSCQVQFQNA
jgi:hypothetical protein